MHTLPTLRLPLLLTAAIFAGCQGAGNGAASGQTPALPTPASVGNSTQAPEQPLTKAPGSKFFAHSYADNGVLFEIWANGTPVTSLQWPNKNVDITGKMRGHANQIAIKWTKLKKNGTGTLSITDAKGTKLMTAVVTNASPAKAQITHLIMAPQAPAGR